MGVCVHVCNNHFDNTVNQLYFNWKKKKNSNSDNSTLCQSFLIQSLSHRYTEHIQGTMPVLSPGPTQKKKKKTSFRRLQSHFLLHTVSMLSCFSRVQFFCNPMECSPPDSCLWFPRQEHWSGLPCPLPGYCPNPGIKPTNLEALALQVDSLLMSHQEMGAKCMNTLEKQKFQKPERVEQLAKIHLSIKV